MLLSDRQVPIVVAPLIDAPNGSAETIRSGLKLDHPVTFQGDGPIVSESEKVKCTKTIVGSVVVRGL